MEVSEEMKGLLWPLGSYVLPTIATQGSRRLDAGSISYDYERGIRAIRLPPLCTLCVDNGVSNKVGDFVTRNVVLDNCKLLIRQKINTYNRSDAIKPDGPIANKKDGLTIFIISAPPIVSLLLRPKHYLWPLRRVLAMFEWRRVGSMAYGFSMSCPSNMISTVSVKRSHRSPFEP